MTSEEFLSRTGGRRNGRWINIAGPGHKKNDCSLGVQFYCGARDGFRLHSFAGDDPEVCRAHVLGLLDGAAAPGAVPREEAIKHREYALKLVAQALPPEGTAVETYLRTRGCDFASITPGEVLFHPACRFGPHVSPAMIGVMRDIQTREIVGVHRTALRDDGRGKRTFSDGTNAKMMLGRARGAAIKLQPRAEVMGVAEGIETALSAQLLFGIPTWSLMSAREVELFPVLPAVTHLTIFADNDAPGHKAATQCARRWGDARRRGVTHIPAYLGNDWNDELLRTAQ